MSDPIEIGATVHLKSGGPAMTVAGFSVSPAPAALQCYWMTRDGVLQTHAFPEVLLDVASANEQSSFSLAARLGNLQTRLDMLEGRVFTMQALNHPQGAIQPEVSSSSASSSYTKIVGSTAAGSSAGLIDSHIDEQGNWRGGARTPEPGANPAVVGQAGSGPAATESNSAG